MKCRCKNPSPYATRPAWTSDDSQLIGGIASGKPQRTHWAAMNGAGRWAGAEIHNRETVTFQSSYTLIIFWKRPDEDETKRPRGARENSIQSYHNSDHSSKTICSVDQMCTRPFKHGWVVPSSRKVRGIEADRSQRWQDNRCGCGI
jgi:hypothetical protein